MPSYVTGQAGSTNFPTMDPLQPANGGGNDAFVTKISPSGSALVYSTYLGGSGGDAGYGVAVDNSGNAYVTGISESTDFPVTPAAFQTVCNLSPTGQCISAFVTKLNPTGSALVYSTYLHGSVQDCGFGIAVDSSHNAYVTGLTNSGDFPVTPGAFQTLCDQCTESNGDAFVTKINPSGSALVYSTYLGGSGSDGGNDIAVDALGNAYITGYTGSTNFPVTSGAFQTALHSPYANAFVAKINPAGSALVYSTYLGGSGDDGGYGVAVDKSGNAYIIGLTSSTDFPTMNPMQPTYGGGIDDAYVAEINPTGSALVYSTYLGGSGNDWGQHIAVDSSGNAYITGMTSSTDFPTMNPVQPTYGGGVYNAFIAKIASIGDATTTTIAAPPITYGADGLVTVSVTSSFGTATGVVTLSVDGGAPLSQDLSGGSTVFTLTGATGGAHSLSASYAAQGDFLASSVSGTLTVNKAGSTTLITANTPNPSAPGQAVVASFQVTGNGRPTGTVTVSAISGEACAGTLNAGTGSCSLTFVTVGSRTLTANYSGDVNFVSSSSAGVTQMVNGPLASLSPPSVNFGNVYLGLLGVQTVILTTIGNASMSISNISISATGSSGGEFYRLSLCPPTLTSPSQFHTFVRGR